MYSLAKFTSRTGRLGTSLAAPFSVFELENVRHRHGATSMIAGTPGSGKSILALNMLAKWAQAGHSIIYFSADSDEFTVARRLAGIISGASMEKIETMSARNIAALLDVPYLAHTRFEYRVARHQDAPEFIADRLAAYEAVYGSFPAVVFVDNLVNFAPSANDWGSMIDLLVELDGISRETMSHICVLHHASESESWTYDPSAGKRRPRGPGDPVPSSSIQGKVTQIPRLVLTIAKNANLRAVVCAKNTNGPDFPDASHWMTFRVEESLRVTDNYQEMM